MNDDKLYRFDYYLSPACPFHINFMQYEQASETPTVLDIHKAIHFGIITSGTITSRICDTTLKIDEKGCYLIAPWEPHGTLRRSAGLGIILISISAAKLMKTFLTRVKLIEQLLNLSPKERMAQLSSPEIKNLATTLGENLKKLKENSEPWNTSLQWHLISGFFLEIIPFLTIDPATPRGGRLEPAIELIYQRSGRWTTVSEAAETCSLSESRFNHLFKEFYGIAFGSYELQYRLNCAAESLLHENLTLKEIAQAWGFFDESHFSRYFKKYFSQSLGSYRKINLEVVKKN